MCPAITRGIGRSGLIRSHSPTQAAQSSGLLPRSRTSLAVSSLLTLDVNLEDLCAAETPVPRCTTPQAPLGPHFQAALFFIFF